MNRHSLSFALLPAFVLLFFAYCSGNATIAHSDEREVQPGEITMTEPAPEKGTKAASETPSSGSPAPAQNTQPGIQEGTTTTNPAPPTLPPGQVATTPCGNGRIELPAASWGSPDTLHNTASESAVVHGDFVTSVGGGICGALLETRMRSGVLVSRNYLPAGLMDFHTGIAKFPRGGFVIAGMRTATLPDQPGLVTQRMVIALVDESAKVIWKNDFEPEGPSLQNWGYAVITDAAGNSYVAANLNGFSVVKLNAEGARIWTYNYAANSGTARAIRFDAEGNLIATGYIDVNLQSTLGDRGVFVVRLSPQKKILWKHRVVSPTLDYAYDLEINKAGQTWIYGWSADQGVTFRKKSLRLPPSFLIRLEKDGTRSAIIDPGITGYTARIAILPDQNLVLSATLISYMPTAPNSMDVTILSPDGMTRLRENSFSSPYWNVLNFMTMSSSGEIYIGSSSGTLIGQAPAYAFGSILKLSEAELIPCNNTR